MAGDIILKECSKCRKEKPLLSFYKDRANKSGLQYSCISCQTVRNVVYRKNHPGYFKTKGKEKYQNNLKDAPDFNRKRYLADQETFLSRRDQYARTVRGRLQALHDAARDRSKKRKKEYLLSVDYLEKIYNKQEGKCALTGIEFTLERNPNGEHFYLPWSPSLDRIESSGHYTEENVRLVCVIVNLALNKFGDEAFDHMCRSYILHKVVTELKGKKE